MKLACSNPRVDFRKINAMLKERWSVWVSSTFCSMTNVTEYLSRVTLRMTCHYCCRWWFNSSVGTTRRRSDCFRFAAIVHNVLPVRPCQATFTRRRPGADTGHQTEDRINDDRHGPRGALPAPGTVIWSATTFPVIVQWRSQVNLWNIACARRLGPRPVIRYLIKQHSTAQDTVVLTVTGVK